MLEDEDSEENSSEIKEGNNKSFKSPLRDIEKEIDEKPQDFKYEQEQKFVSEADNEVDELKKETAVLKAEILRLETEK